MVFNGSSGEFCDRKIKIKTELGLALTTDQRIQTMRTELDRLRAQERSAGRLFYTAIPALAALAALWLCLRENNPNLWFLIVPLTLLSLAAVTNIVRFGAPRRFTDIHERIARKEGELAALGGSQKMKD
jgi:hypothetical protein